MTTKIPRSEVVAKLRELASKLMAQSGVDYSTSVKLSAEDMRETSAYEHGKSVAHGQSADAIRALANEIGFGA